MPHGFTPSPPRRKPPANRPLADLVGGAMAPALAKHGFGEAEILLHWPEIVGAELAGHCQPLRLQWPPRRAAADAKREPATLVVRVESASALVLQHSESVVIERLNAFLGWRCIGRLALRQGPLPQRQDPKPRPAAPTTAALAAAARAVGDVDDDGLRQSLLRLGARVLAGRGLR